MSTLIMIVDIQAEIMRFDQASQTPGKDWVKGRIQNKVM
jgi:hypothetical protein